MLVYVIKEEGCICRLDNEERMRNELMAKIRQKENEKEENTKRLEKLAEYIG